MARTYLSTLSPRRRWGIAGCAAGIVLVITAAVGNPWSWSTISQLQSKPVGDRVPLLAGALSVFHWTVKPGESGAPAGQSTSHWIAGLVLDLGWPLLVLLGTRMLAGGLALRRAKLSLVLGVWSVSTLTAAATGLIAGLVDHHVDSVMRIVDLPLTGAVPTGDVLALQAATMGLLGAVLGWLPGVTAAIGYSVGRETATSPVTEEDKAENSLVTTGEMRTLDLEALESLRKARRRSTEGALPDAATSTFFAAE
ncbi:MAG: hypothetical protein ACRDVE_00270 [Actinocrinis sp.]